MASGTHALYIVCHNRRYYTESRSIGGDIEGWGAEIVRRIPTEVHSYQGMLPSSQLFNLAYEPQNGCRECETDTRKLRDGSKGEKVGGVIDESI